jgi:sialic acid synthase SpsE
MRIGKFDIKTADRPMIVAEIGAAHNGNKTRAINLIAHAAAAGADAVKIQAFTPDTITGNFQRPEFIIQEGPWKGRHLFELYQEAHMPREWFEDIFAYAKANDITIFPSVFSIEDIEFVKQFDPPAMKIASFELVDPVLIKAAMWNAVPLVLSTGMASWGEINMAATAVRNYPAIWMHCVSCYPTPLEKANLRFMDVLRRQFDFVGLSDHTLGNEAAMMAVARGAVMIEKHITLTPNGVGLDDEFATSAAKWPGFVKAIHRAAAALGTSEIDWKTGARDDSEHAPLRRSLYVVEPVRAGSLLTPYNVKSIRPGLGLAPSMYGRVIGRTAGMDIPAGTPLAEHMIAEIK